MKYYYAARIEADGGATEIDGAQVVLAEEYDRLRELLVSAVDWTRDRGYDDPETAPEWFLSALQEVGDER